MFLTESMNLLWLGKMAKSLFIFLFLFFSFLIGLTTTRWSVGKYHVTLSQCHNGGTDGQVTVTVTVCHMTRVTWGPWESKHIATVVKCISSREMSKNSIEFSLSNSEQRDSWLNSSHWTLDADRTAISHYCTQLPWLYHSHSFALLFLSFILIDV